MYAKTFLVLITVTSVAFATNNFFLPASDNVDGMNLAQLNERWWVWVNNAPEGKDPADDLTGRNCTVQQSGSVWFLAGSYEQFHVQRSCVVPFGKKIAGPLINFVSSCDQGSRQAAFDNPSQLSLVIDVVSYTKKQLLGYRALLKCGQSKNHPDNFFDGYYYLLKPLPKGKHSLSVKSNTSIFSQDISYTLVIQ